MEKHLVTLHALVILGIFNTISDARVVSVGSNPGRIASLGFQDLLRHFQLLDPYGGSTQTLQCGHRQIATGLLGLRILVRRSDRLIDKCAHFNSIVYIDHKLVTSELIQDKMYSQGSCN